MSIKLKMPFNHIKSIFIEIIIDFHCEQILIELCVVAFSRRDESWTLE